MTCIVGLIDKGTVWMGGDSAISCGDYLSRRREPKVFKRDAPNGAMLIGCSGSPRVSRLMQHVFEPPPRDDSVEPMRYLVGDFADALRECLKDHGALVETDGANANAKGSHCIIGYKQRLFYMDDDFNFYEPEWDFEATGTGCEVACGALHVTQGMEGERRVRVALGAAADLITTVCAPFHILSLK